jgi:16S rRNA (uracil1498-N3)-methyltransferase
MSLPRAFVSPARAEPGRTIELDAGESHYLVRVRRCRVGQAIELLDGEGRKFEGELVRLGENASVRVGQVVREIATPEVVLLFALVDPAPCLQVIAGANELGATELVLVDCERGQGRMPSGERVQRVLRASMRQCGRARALLVTGPVPFEDALAHAPHLPGVVAQAGSMAGESFPTRTGARVLVGPEGGFTAAEAEAAYAAGFTPISLGPFTLRAETAALASLTLALHGARTAIC